MVKQQTFLIESQKPVAGKIKSQQFLCAELIPTADFVFSSQDFQKSLRISAWRDLGSFTKGEIKFPHCFNIKYSQIIILTHIFSNA